MSSRGTPRTRAVGKALVLLRALALAETPPTASELARIVGMPRATVARTLRTLADGDLVSVLPMGGWTLGYELVRLGRLADPHRTLAARARPVLAEVCASTGESALLGVPVDDVGLEIVTQVDGHAFVGVSSWVGRAVPLHASAAGKLVLASLEPARLERWLAEAPRERFTRATLTSAAELAADLARVRRRDWASLVDELEVGLTSIAVAVRGSDRRLVAMLGVSGPTFRLGPTHRRALVPPLRAAAARLAASL